MADVETWGWRIIKVGIGLGIMLAVAAVSACVIGAFFLWGALVAS